MQADSQVWGDRYDGEIEDVFTIQSNIAQEIVAQLRVRLSPEEKAAVEERPTNDLTAYEQYVGAKRLIDGAVFSATAKIDLANAAGMLTQAVNRDPNFVAAFYQLAHAHDQLYLRFDRTPARLSFAEPPSRPWVASVRSQVKRISRSRNISTGATTTTSEREGSSRLPSGYYRTTRPLRC